MGGRGHGVSLWVHQVRILGYGVQQIHLLTYLNGGQQLLYDEAVAILITTEIVGAIAGCIGKNSPYPSLSMLGYACNHRVDGRNYFER